METPLVSICCITYNHAPFIRRCLDGFLMQKVNFPLEILIHDDCSTDGTTDVVKEYAAKYPDLIYPLYESVNQYSNGKAGVIDFFNYKRARGTYVAYCEGDDYWTDPLKLQKQVDFMEANPEYVVCFHNTTIYNTKTNSIQTPLLNGTSEDFDVTADMFINAHSRIGQPLSMVFRLSNYDYEWQKHYTRYCDSMEIFHLLRTGKGRFMQFIGGQYNLQQGGVSASNTDIRRSWEDIEDYQQMWAYTKDRVVLNKCLNSYLWRLNVCKRNNMQKEYWYAVWYAIIHNSKIGFKVLYKAIKRRFKNN